MSTIGPASTPREPGAPAAADVIPLCIPHLAGNEWRYVKECLDTNWVSSAGPFVTRFETMLSEYVGRGHAVAIVNGTAALHIGLLVAGVGSDDEVLVSTLTFVAPVNAIRYCGACPVFVDAEPATWQMDAQRLKDFLDTGCVWRTGALFNRTTGKRVRAILPVHILGAPCDLAPIVDVAKRYDLVVIEDATEALGARYQNAMAGRAGDLACFSFNGNKIITTGGGGMVVTDNQEWAAKARYLSTQAKDDPVEYVHEEVGYNYRLTNVQAAMGVAQLEQLPAFVARKRDIAARYDRELAAVDGLTTNRVVDGGISSCWMYTVSIDSARFGRDRRSTMGVLAERGIESRPLWTPIHMLTPYRGCPRVGGEVAEEIQQRALSLPCSVGLQEADQAAVIDAMRTASASS